MREAALLRIRVAVDHVDPLVAIGLHTVLGQQADMDLVALPPPGCWDGAAAGEGGAPQIVVADYARGLHLAGSRPGRPRGSGGLRVLVVTVNDREQAVRAALDQGVEGFLELGCPVQELISGVRQLARGSRYLSAAAARRMADSLAYASLTAREHEVLAWVVRGKSNKAIAQGLAVSLGTIKAHMKALLDKLGAASRTEAANIAVTRGLVPPG
jgi:two-component system response regulator DesR